MGTENETLRWPTNLDRAAIEKRLVHARELALQQGLTDVANLLADVEHKPELRSYTLQL